MKLTAIFVAAVLISSCVDENTTLVFSENGNISGKSEVYYWSEFQKEIHGFAPQLQDMLVQAGWQAKSHVADDDKTVVIQFSGNKDTVRYRIEGNTNLYNLHNDDYGGYGITFQSAVSKGNTPPDTQQPKRFITISCDSTVPVFLISYEEIQYVDQLIDCNRKFEINSDLAIYIRGEGFFE